MPPTAKASKEFVQKEIEPMLAELLELAKQNDFYAFYGLDPSATKQQIEQAWRIGAAKLHPDVAGRDTTDEAAEWNYVYSNYFQDDDILRVYHAVHTIDRTFYAKIPDGQLKNLIEFHDRSVDLIKVITKMSSEKHKDLSRLKQETEKRIEILRKIIQHIDPSKTPKSGIDLEGLDLRQLLMLLMVLEGIKKDKDEDNPSEN